MSILCGIDRSAIARREAYLADTDEPLTDTQAGDLRAELQQASATDAALAEATLDGLRDLRDCLQAISDYLRGDTA